MQCAGHISGGTSDRVKKWTRPQEESQCKHQSPIILQVAELSPRTDVLMREGFRAKMALGPKLTQSRIRAGVTLNIC
jgi:hypothetical protein